MSARTHASARKHTQAELELKSRACKYAIPGQADIAFLLQPRMSRHTVFFLPFKLNTHNHTYVRTQTHIYTFVHARTYTELEGKRALMYSYGSGLAATMFSLRFRFPEHPVFTNDILERLSSRRWTSPEVCVCLPRFGLTVVSTHHVLDLYKHATAQCITST